MFGSASGFCLAFGTDINGFRNPIQAAVTIALFTLGEFEGADYRQLIVSQRFLGPVLFWLYIFLVFFVLMSVFIAILSEGYEAAKERIPATQNRDIWEAMQTVVVENAGDLTSGARGWFKAKQRLKIQSLAVSAIGAFAEAGATRNAREEACTTAAKEEHSGDLLSHKDANIETDSGSESDDGAGTGHGAGKIAFGLYKQDKRDKGSKRVYEAEAEEEEDNDDDDDVGHDDHGDGDDGGSDKEVHHTSTNMRRSSSSRDEGHAPESTVTTQTPGPRQFDALNREVSSLATQGEDLGTALAALAKQSQENEERMLHLQDAVAHLTTLATKQANALDVVLAGLNVPRYSSAGSNRSLSPTREGTTSPFFVSDDDSTHYGPLIEQPGRASHVRTQHTAQPEHRTDFSPNRGRPRSSPVAGMSPSRDEWAGAQALRRSDSVAGAPVQDDVIQRWARNAERLSTPERLRRAM